ncbi:MAG: hypothetical protein FJX80_12755 [Bacteroidetes bacterium]|nr:hypothetical protein [Bacteroidota bacterium]
MSFFKKLTDSFTSNETRFTSAMTKFLVGKLNDMGTLSITTFPNGLKGKSCKIPSEIPLSKLSTYPNINLPELVEQFVYFGLLYKADGVKGWVKENVQRFHTEVKSNNPSLNISVEEMFEIFEHYALMFKHLLEKEQVIPSSGLLYDNSLTFESEGKYDNIFRTFYLLVGYFSFVAMPIFGKCQEEIESFLKEQKSNSFKSFSDFSHGNLLKNIYEKNVSLGLIEREKLNIMHNTILNIGTDSDNFSLEAYIEWLKLVFIYNGNSLEIANERIGILNNRLNEISENWAEIGRIGMIVSDFDNISWMKRFELLPKTMISIYKLHYQKI